MVREWRRLLVDPARLAAAAGVLVLESQERHYLQRVLRLRPGETLAVIDGCGHLWTARFQPDAGRGPARAELDPCEPLQTQPPPYPDLRLAVTPPRRDAEVLLRMACELGIDGVQWLQSERSLPEAVPRRERQAAVLREALEQCERLWLPDCPESAPLTAWLAGADHGLRLFATTRHSGALALPLLLADQVRPMPDRVTLAIGPEGGWTPAEEAAALGAGWQPVSLVAPILRTSTAAVAAAALLCSWRDARS